VDVINRLLAPIPGRGIYRFTLPEGSPSNPPPAEEGFMLREAITVSTQPKKNAPAAGSALEPLLGDWEENPTPSGLDALRAKLPAGLKNLSNAVLFGGAGAILLLVVLGVVAWAMSGPTPTTSPVGPVATGSSPPLEPRKPAKEGPFARPDELSEAKAGGAKAYEDLLEKYPRDPNIAVELARDLFATKNYTGTVGAVGRALSIDPAYQNNAQVASLVFQTAQVKASSDAAFALLEGAMGARGADIAYDLVTTEKVRPWVQSRAETFLQSKEFEKVATPGLRAIVKLRYSAGCDEKRALFGELKKSSDERALFELVPLQDRTGCGARKKDDCYPCLRTSNDLDDTIAAVRSRKR
jgi:hypothetical protein